MIWYAFCFWTSSQQLFLDARGIVMCPSLEVELFSTWWAKQEKQGPRREAEGIKQPAAAAVAQNTSTANAAPQLHPSQCRPYAS